MRYLLTMMFSLLPMAAHAADVAKVCQLGPGPAHRIKVTREAEIADSYIYKLGYAGKSQYFYDSADMSRGLSVHIACVGKKRHALVAYGEFTANFLQGFVIVRSPQTGKIHRLNFAERSPPRWIYTNNGEILVVMPTHGAGEYGNSKFVVYRRANIDGAAATVRGANALPPVRGFEVTQLREGALE